MQGHVVVCGLGTLGVRVVELLRDAGVVVVVVDDRVSARGARRLTELDVRLVAAPPGEAAALRAGGLDTALALVVVLDDDLAALEALLVAQEVRPGLRAALRLRATRVGEQVVRAMPHVRVLDVSELAAASFVEACLGRGALHHFTIDTDEAVVAEVPAPRDGSLRELFGDLAPVAVVHADGRQTVGPGRDERVLAGERVALVGFPADFADTGLRPQAQEQEQRAARRRGARLRAVRRTAATVAAEVDRPFRLILGAVIVLALVATLVLHAAYRPLPGQRFGLLDAAYFAVETMATVGFGDFSYAGQSRLLTAFGVMFIVLGALTVSATYAFLTNLLVSRRIERSLGRRRATGAVAHVIVCGLGSVGLRVVRGLLAEGRDVVVIERDEANRNMAAAQALHVPVVIGDATSPDVLRDAGLATAAAIAVMTSDSAANLETALTVTGERAGPAIPVVLRMYDRDLARRVETTFGLQLARSSRALAAPWFVGAAIGFEVVSTFYVDQQPFMVARVDITAGGGLDGTAMQDLPASTRVLAIARASEGLRLEHTPRRATRFEGGDRAYLAGGYGDVIAVVRRNGVGVHV